MKNKQYMLTAKLLLCMSFVFMSVSCKEDYDNIKGGQRHTEAPVLKTTTPVANATVDLFTESVDLVFDREVTVVDLAQIKVSGALVTGSSINGDTLTLMVDGLEENTQYTLTVAKGAIKGVPGILNQEDINLPFKTGDAPQITQNLVMPNASVQARKVYTFLMDNYRKKVISGAMAKVDWNTVEADRVKYWTEKYPALNCFDFIHIHAGYVDYTNTSVVENWWNKNGLVSIMWHWNVPVSEGSNSYGFYYTGKNGGNGETSFDISKAVQAGTYENTIVKQNMDVVADRLLALQAKGIPVIWRPLHEGAGGWFWWGAKGAESYKALWKMMFDAFKAKGINNLIWVWTTETGDSSWYPGDAYVDIVGRDIYNNTDSYKLYKQYWSIRKQYPNKMVTLSECGKVATISDQWTAKAKWSWFMPWYDYNATNSSEHIYADKSFWLNAFGMENVITLDKMPSLK